MLPYSVPMPQAVLRVPLPLPLSAVPRVPRSLTNSDHVPPLTPPHPTPYLGCAVSGLCALCSHWIVPPAILMKPPTPTPMAPISTHLNVAPPQLGRARHTSTTLGTTPPGTNG